MAKVVLEHIEKLYENGYHAVSDLNLDIADGEFLVLVGPSGCGKSTALRMVAGLEDISGGELYIGDRLCNDLPPQDRDIAMVFQSYALYPHMSVADNIAYGLKLRKMPKAEIQARIKKAADMLELNDYLERKPAQLSGGQRQRVAMGRAIVREPAVFLMDEPLSNLDAKLRVQMRAEISSVVRSLGTTTIYVTHDQVEAMTMGDRMAVMKKGILNQVGSPQEVYDHPNNIFVAQFVGSPPMNLVQGRLERQGEQVVVKVGPATLAVPQETLDRRPALAGYVGRDVAIGVRSEDMEDASLQSGAPADRVLEGRVTLVEALGAEIVVHFDLDGEAVETDDTKLVAKEAGDVIDVSGVSGVKWVASFAPRSRVAIGDNVKIVVDMERVHWFDPETSEAIRG
ncbi:MAG: sn-glycerol-3-phosphate ABC transporter ATP-binding protein UgpC [Actinobacteria bacterium]|nr:MAG: sn-glycerol-3-phosphate ABC transporter ATP-binding protein UgpC [Actinomycetota bacterium]